MRAAWSALKIRVHNRLARHWRTAPFQMRNKSPMVSFTFDDAPKSAVTTGIQILNEYQARAGVEAGSPAPAPALAPPCGSSMAMGSRKPRPDFS